MTGFKDFDAVSEGLGELHAGFQFQGLIAAAGQAISPTMGCIEIEATRIETDGQGDWSEKTPKVKGPCIVQAIDEQVSVSSTHFACRLSGI